MVLIGIMASLGEGVYFLISEQLRLSITRLYTNLVVSTSTNAAAHLTSPRHGAVGTARHGSARHGTARHGRDDAMDVGRV